MEEHIHAVASLAFGPDFTGWVFAVQSKADEDELWESLNHRGIFLVNEEGEVIIFRWSEGVRYTVSLKYDADVALAKGNSFLKGKLDRLRSCNEPRPEEPGRILPRE